MGIANVQLKERKTLTLNDFRGVDFSSSPFSVVPNRAVEMENFMMVDGRMRKRPGWEVVADGLNGQIYGIYYFEYEYHERESKVFVVHCGKKLYAFERERFLKGDISMPIAEYTGVKNITTSFLRIDDSKLLIVCGELVVFKGRTFVSASDSDLCYMPTVLSSQVAIHASECKVETVEKINLLTRWRKNRLEPPKEFDEYNNQYTLDADWDSSTTMTAVFPQCFGKEGDSYEEISPWGSTELISWKYESGRGVTIPNEWPQSEEVLKEEAWTFLIGTNPDKTDEEIAFAWICSSEYVGTGKTMVMFSESAMKHLTTTTEAITITYCAKGEDKSQRLMKCTRSALFGINGNANSLVLTGSYDQKNAVYYSQLDNLLYFPDTNFFTVGSSDSYVRGFMRLEDDTLAVFKDGEGMDSRMYYVKGSELTEYDSDGEVKWYTMKCTVWAGGIGERLIAPDSVAVLAGDKLMLTDNGVKGIVLTDNSYVNARYAKDRSYNINARLRTHADLSSAVATVYKNRYYLAIDGGCYVADPDYRFYLENDKDQSFNYEWWYWTNVPACYFAEIEGELWFGTKDGRVCRFKKDSYTDDEKWEISEAWNKLTEDVTEDKIDYNKELINEIEEAEEIIFYPIDEISVIVGEKEGDLTGIPLFISERGSYEEKGVTYPCFKLKCKEMDETPVDIKSFTSKEFRAMLIKRKPVVARWLSAYFDMGSNVYLKTLLRLTVSADSAAGEKLRFGYQTKQGSATHELKGQGYMDFEDMSFLDFSFDTVFADSYTKKLNVRNFNYIQFRFVADGKKDVAINDLTATYKINKLSRGIR